VDARRGKLFAKLIKNVEVAARTGGADPAGNPTLYDAVQKAKKSSVPNENIDRAIRRGAGLEAGGAQYETVTYEGYAPGGVAVLVECLTDNRNRGAAHVRAAPTRNGGGRRPPRPPRCTLPPHGGGGLPPAAGVTTGGRRRGRGGGRGRGGRDRPRPVVRGDQRAHRPGDGTERGDRCGPGVRVGRGRVPAHGRGRPGRGSGQAGVPADRGARRLRRRAGRLRELLRLRRHHGKARLTTPGDTPRCLAARAVLGR